jgi:ABC-type glycerol-3-phosphate transport system substrate-binding protein
MLRSLLIGLLGITLLAGCNRIKQSAATEAPESEPAGTILLWHYWTDKDAEVLNKLIAQFEDLYKGINVISIYVPIDDIEKKYLREAQYGFAPDLLLTPNNLIVPLVRQNLLLALDDVIKVSELAVFKIAALQSLRSKGKLYGLPVTLDTYAMYYNTDLVKLPAQTLEQLLNESKRGKVLALRTTFFGAVWGISAFGGKVQTPEGQILLNQGGFEEWLNWLKSAQESPYVLMSNDKTPLLDKFRAGEAAYYTGDSRDLPKIRASLGDKVAVTTLPSGPGGNAAPYLESEALLFNRGSSAQQRSLALQFASFLTSAEQQRTLMRDLGRVPANDQVRIDTNAESTIGGFEAQSKQSLDFKGNDITRELIFGKGREIYEQVLGGVISPRTAAQRLTELNRSFDFPVPERPSDSSCTIPTGCP